ncbi:hypothetical protein [Pseudomonas putida]
MGLISLVDFCESLYKSHDPHGLSITPDIPKLLEELHSIVRRLAKGNLDAFYVQERSLYQPLKELLEYHLPARNLVMIENALHKTAFPTQRTDLAIRRLGHVQRGRLSCNIECSHFIEIKSVFFGETLRLAAIQEDFAKLLRCEQSYSAICFFVLTGLEADLMKSHGIVKLLQLQSEKKLPLRLKTNDGDLFWLTRVGAVLKSDPMVFIWRITRSPPDSSLQSSGCSYSIFQKH